MQVGTTQSFGGLNGTKRQRKKESALGAWAGMSIFGPQTSASLVLRPLDLDQDFSHRPLILRPQTWAELHWLSWFSRLQKTDCGPSQPLFWGEPTPRLNLLFIYTYICISHFSVSLVNPNTAQRAQILHTSSAEYATKHKRGITQRKWKP